MTLILGNVVRPLSTRGATAPTASMFSYSKVTGSCGKIALARISTGTSFSSMKEMRTGSEFGTHIQSQRAFNNAQGQRDYGDLPPQRQRQIHAPLVILDSAWHHP